MHPKVDESPLGERLPEFSADTLVFDTVYNPIETKLLKQAKAAGAKTVGGVEMFVRQAARQFEAWTGKPAPLEIFRRVVVDRLTAPRARDSARDWGGTQILLIPPQLLFTIPARGHFFRSVGRSCRFWGCWSWLWASGFSSATSRARFRRFRAWVGSPLPLAG
jgi:hypothetical protein